MKKLLLVDGSSYLYRAYHAAPPLTSPQGEPTGACFAMLNMLRKLSTQAADYTHCAVVFDEKGKNFRHDLYPEYKANRPPMPDDLRPQAEKIRVLAALSGWHVLAIAGVEADDVIATLAKKGRENGFQVAISSGDKDLMQLVNDEITIIDTMKDAVYNRDGVFAKFAVYPEQIVDYLTLVGDKVDNVPGVEKCGAKTAAKWLAEFGSLDNLIAHSDEISGKIGDNLRSALPHLPLSKQLILLKDNVDLPCSLDDLARKDADYTQLLPHFQALGFKSLIKMAEEALSSSQTIFRRQIAVSDLSLTDMSLRDEQNARRGNLPENKQTDDLFGLPEHISEQSFRQPEKVETHYFCVKNQHDLDDLCHRLQNAQKVGFDTETTSLNPQDARLVGLSFAFAAGNAVYVQIAHDLTFLDNLLTEKEIWSALTPFLQNPNLHKVGQNLKYDRHVLANHGIDLQGIAGDSMLASYLLESHLSHNLDDLCERHFQHTTIKFEDLCGKGKKQISFAEVPLEKACEYACQDADYALRLETLLREKMDSGSLKLYEELELPVANILFQMERTGVLIDKDELYKQSNELGSQILQLEQQAYQLAGQPFNLNSPKQLQKILFNKLGIPTKGVKKTPTGEFSTNEAVLEKLALDYPLPKIILENRGLAKLKSTYTDKLPQLLDANGRVHTTYAQAVAVTGRLASNNPNLQNIPIRTEQGRKIRQAFIAPLTHCIISADYSQIELRIMAHLSGDTGLITAFNQGEDIHRRTAAEVFNTLPEKVSSEQRRYAKTINFGLIYGMGRYGLAQSLNIDPQDAQNFIERYFARYPAVAEYIERTKQQAHINGFVETLFGRRLYLPEINASNKLKQAAAERAAVNAPMQGTASDIIKKAMIAVDDWLISGSLKSQIIMQVHDELILQVPENEQEIVCQALPKLMASVAELSVPLLAEVGVCENWEKAH
ncbi:MAG: DNA polymerase I [Neisseriaceae bacterium]|nr:DNA polymerase I [Neisseriaceae bacterium]